jgi:ubiquinol-cytochrome c reductase cytochrome b subunit
MTTRPSTLRRANAALDERLGSQSFLKRAFDHIFPDNWSFMLGEVALYCFIVLVATGIYLAFFFDPSDSQVVYHGSYVPLRGQSMSLAYQSTVSLSLDVRLGLLFRQVHHWAADIFLAVIALHLMRIFFTGAFRKPRDINWVVGVTLLLLSIFNGFSGYSLPDDLLSGGGLRIAYSIAQSVPVIGNWLAYLFIGGQFPSPELTHRLYIAHVFVVPLLIGGLLGVHLALIWRQKHTQFPGAGRSQRKVVGSQLWPTYSARSIGLLCAVVGALALLGGVAQINPIWLYGPYHPQSATAAAQPDWYVGWLEGALRLFPAWRLHLFGYTVSEVFWPAVVFPLTCFAVLYSWPFFERWWTSDLLAHNLLDRPRDRPGRTAFGVAALTLFFILIVAGAQDVLAQMLATTQPPVTLTLRGLAIGLPIATGLIAWRICTDLAAGGPLPPTEPPRGPADSATLSKDSYLPARARYDLVAAAPAGEPVIAPRGDRSPAFKASAVAGLVVTVVTGLIRWRRRGAPTAGRPPSGPRVRGKSGGS